MANVQKRLEKFAKLWYIEASTYNFSINLSLGLANAFMVKILGYGLSELGLLVAIRILALAVSQLPAIIIVLNLRSERKRIWLYAGTVNRVGWALVILAFFIPKPLDIVYLSALSLVSQFAGGVAGVAAMDAVGDNVPGSFATEVFSKVNKFSYASILLSQLVSVMLFVLPLEPLTSYLVVYTIALISAVVSTAFLYYIPDQSKDSTTRMVINWHCFKNMVEDSKLKKYLLTISLFNFATSIPAPFWDYIVLSATGGAELFVVLKNVAYLGVKVYAVDFWQKLARKHGLKKTVVEGMMFTSLVPLLYSEASRSMDFIVAEAVSGFVWAPVDVGTSIYSVYLPASTVRPVYLSVVNLLINGVSTLATTVGTVVAISAGNVYTVLVMSAVLRALSATVAYKILPEVDENNGVNK